MGPTSLGVYPTLHRETAAEQLWDPLRHESVARRTRRTDRPFDQRPVRVVSQDAAKPVTNPDRLGGDRREDAAQHGADDTTNGDVAA